MRKESTPRRAEITIVPGTVTSPFPFFSISREFKLGQSPCWEPSCIPGLSGPDSVVMSCHEQAAAMGAQSFLPFLLLLHFVQPGIPKGLALPTPIRRVRLHASLPSRPSRSCIWKHSSRALKTAVVTQLPGRFCGAVSQAFFPWS